MSPTEPTCRLVLLVDASAPTAARADVHEATLGLTRWAGQWDLPVALSVLDFGPSGRSVAASTLGDALRVASTHAPDAVVLVLHGEPGGGWQDVADVAVACTVLTRAGTPPAATGTGLLGPTFAAAHTLHALQWAVCDARDNTGVTGLRARVGDRVVALWAGQRLWPHHLGRPMVFDAPVAEVVAHETTGKLGLRNVGTAPWTSSRGDCPVGKAWTLKDGLRFHIDGVPVAVRAAPAKRSDRFRVTPVRATPGECAGCGGALGSVAVGVPPDPRLFCGGCVDRTHVCDFCHLPLGDRGVAWPDGRMACPACRSSAILHKRDLEALSRAARSWLSGKLAMHTDTVPLHFADAPTIAAMHGRTFVRGPNSPPREAGFYRHWPVPGIWIEHAAPRNYCFGVLVHEWTHAWHIPRLPEEPVTLAAVEGLAMWTEWHALTDVGATVEAHRAETMGGVYGVGLQLYRALEGQMGFDSVPRVDPRLFG